MAFSGLSRNGPLIRDAQNVCAVTKEGKDEQSVNTVKISSYNWSVVALIGFHLSATEGTSSQKF